MKKSILTAQLILPALITLSVFSYGQKKLETDKAGILVQTEYSKLRKANGYDGISQFDTISKNPVLVYAVTLKNKKFGIIDIYGKEILKPDYEEIAGMYFTNSALSAYHDHFLLKNEKGWAISDYKGKLITPFIYDMLTYEEYDHVGRRLSPEKWPLPIYKDSIFKARQKEDYIYLNIKGEKIQYSQRDDRLQFRTKASPDNYGVPKSLGSAKPFTDNLFQIQSTDGKSLSGVYDKTLRKMILPVEFNYVAFWNKALFLSANRDNGTYAYDLKGNLLSKEPMSYFSQAGNEKTPVILATNKSKKYAVFSKNFKPLTEFIYDYIKPSNYFLNGTIEANGTQERKTVLMNLEGKPIKFNVDYDQLRFKTNEFDDVAEAFISLRKKDKFAIVNHQGKLISDFVYDEILPECFVASDKFSLYEERLMSANHPNRFIYFKKDNKYGIMDNDYKVILNNSYDMIIESILDPYVYIAKDSSGKKKWGVYNVGERKEIIAPQFDTQIKSSDQFFIVNRNGKYGVYNTQGKEVLPIIYDHEISIDKRYNGMYYLSQYGTPIGYMDSLGNLIKSTP